jgi:hypothetical protein
MKKNLATLFYSPKADEIAAIKVGKTQFSFCP